MTDLWPTTIGENINNSPVAIMREQAQLLGQKTQNLVEAEVDLGSSHDEKFVYYFYIVAPTLNNYHFRLFTVQHDIDFYPLSIYVDETLGKEIGAGYAERFAAALQRHANTALAAAGYTQPSAPYLINISSEDEFLDALKKILSSQRAQHVISSLLGQVKSDYPPIVFAQGAANRHSA